MYHRYQPMGNGRFQRQTVPSPPSGPQNPPPDLRTMPEQSRQEKPPAATQPGDPPQQTGAPPWQNSRQPGSPPPRNPPQSSAGPTQSDPMSAQAPNFHLPFLERLLPGMDNGDILLVLILLLLLSEGNEDATSVIMTLTIFLFLQ